MPAGQLSPSHSLNLAHCEAHFKPPGTTVGASKEPSFEVVEQVTSTGIKKVFKVRSHHRSTRTTTTTRRHPRPTPRGLSLCSLFLTRPSWPSACLPACARCCRTCLSAASP